MRWIELSQRTAAEQVSAIPSSPERYVRRSKTVEVQRMDTLRRRPPLRIFKMRSEEFGDLPTLQVIDTNLHSVCPTQKIEVNVAVNA
jgi:hypothetical protein